MVTLTQLNKTLQATPDGRSSSAFAEDIIRPACLSSGRSGVIRKLLSWSYTKSLTA
jgi:hypothetical protein